MIAERWPASGWPIKSQFFLPIAVGRMEFSARFVSGHFKTGQLWSLQNQPL
jgi:hypothetical protein